MNYLAAVTRVAMLVTLGWLVRSAGIQSLRPLQSSEAWQLRNVVLWYDLR